MPDFFNSRKQGDNPSRETVTGSGETDTAIGGGSVEADDSLDFLDQTPEKSRDAHDPVTAPVAASEMTDSSASSHSSANLAANSQPHDSTDASVGENADHQASDGHKKQRRRRGPRRFGVELPDGTANGAMPVKHAAIPLSLIHISEPTRPY